MHNLVQKMLIYATTENYAPLIAEGTGNNLKEVIGELEKIIGDSCKEINDPNVVNFSGDRTIKRTIESENGSYFIYGQIAQFKDAYMEDTELFSVMPASDILRFSIYPKDQRGSEFISNMEETINQNGTEYLKSLKPSKVQKTFSLMKEVGSYEINGKYIVKGLDLVFSKSLKVARSLIF